MRPLLILVLALGIVGAEGSAPDEPKFPAQVRAIEGEALDIAELAGSKRLIVVTLKATWCTVCQRQLIRLRQRLPEIEGCGVTLLVLGPGPRSELAEIQERIDFPYPFVEDVDLEIATTLGLKLSDKEIFPAIFALRHDRTIGWMQRGRNAQYFGDPALVKEVGCWSSI